MTNQSQPYLISQFSENTPNKVSDPAATAEKALHGCFFFATSDLLGKLSAGQAGFWFDFLP